MRRLSFTSKLITFIMGLRILPGLGKDVFPLNWIPGIEKMESVSLSRCILGPKDSKYLCFIASAALIRSCGSYWKELLALDNVFEDYSFYLKKF